MNPLFKFLPVLLFVLCADSPAAELHLTSPVDYQVVQRTTPGKGLVRIVGELTETPPSPAVIEAKLSGENLDTPWQRVGGSVSGQR